MLKQESQTLTASYDLFNANARRPCSVVMPIRASDGGLLRKKVGGNWQVAMIQPEVFNTLGVAVGTPLNCGKSEAMKIFEKYHEKGMGTFSKLIPYEVESKRLLAANAQNPDESWLMMDRNIRELDKRTENNEMQLMRQLGLVTDDLGWSVLEYEGQVRTPIKKMANDLFALTQFNPNAIQDVTKARFGNFKIPIPVTYRPWTTGTRAITAAGDRYNSMDAAEGVLLQTNFNLLGGTNTKGELNGGITAFGGDYWKGLINNDFTQTFDNTLDGTVPGGTNFTTTGGIEAILNFVKREFVAARKFGNFGMMAGENAQYTLSDTIDDTKTDKVTLATVMAEKAKVLNGGQDFVWGISYKMPANDAMFILRDTKFINLKTSGGMTILELDSNPLGNNGIVYVLTVLVTNTDGSLGSVSVIYISGICS